MDQKQSMARYGLTYSSATGQERPERGGPLDQHRDGKGNLAGPTAQIIGTPKSPPRCEIFESWNTAGV
jgi:hypothetical protein